MLNLAIKSQKHLAVAQHFIQTHLSWKGKDGNNTPAVTRKKVIKYCFFNSTSLLLAAENTTSHNRNEFYIRYNHINWNTDDKTKFNKNLYLRLMVATINL